MRAPWIATAAALTLTLASATSEAQWIGNRPRAHQIRTDVELHGILHNGYWRHSGYGFGFGFRVDVPLLPNGPLTRVNNSFSLSFGADLFWYDYYRHGQYSYLGLTSPVVVQWTFYLFPSFSVFAEGGLAFQLFDDVDGFFVWPGFAVGGRVHFGGRAGYPSFIFRLGFPVGITLGINF